MAARMSEITQERLLYRLATADLADLPSLQREACCLLNLPVPEADALTEAEREVLGTLNSRQRTARDVAAETYLSLSYTKQLLSRLQSKGYAMRVGHYHFGGWVKVRDAE